MTADMSYLWHEAPVAPGLRVTQVYGWLLGYQEVREPGSAPYAQVRMTALIDSLGPRRPDPDGGRMYRRLLAPVGDAPAILGWGEPAVAQAAAVGRLARARWGLRVDAPGELAGYAD